MSYLGSELFDLVGQLFALTRVLPLGRLLALDDLQQVQVFLFEFLFLRQQLVETVVRRVASCAARVVQIRDEDKITIIVDRRKYKDKP